MGFEKTMIGNSTGQSPEKGPLNQNEDFGNWKQNMGKRQPLSAEGKRLQEQRDQEGVEHMLKKIKIGPKDSPEVQVQHAIEASKKGGAIMLDKDASRLWREKADEQIKQEKQVKEMEEKMKGGFWSRLGGIFGGK